VLARDVLPLPPSLKADHGSGLDRALSSGRGNSPAEDLAWFHPIERLSRPGCCPIKPISVSYISMLERGQRSPPLETLDALAKALRVSPLELLQAGGGKRRR
jgi:transcriptional regulator with XRE-family HTH domain